MGAVLALALTVPLAPVARAQGTAEALPPEVQAALARAKLPRESVSLLVVDAEGRQPPRLAWRAQQAVQPASVMKLVTTFAALDLLGPAYVWTTPVYTDGRLIDGTLHGNLYIRGQGDPSLVMERLWLLLRRVQALGIRQIAGDIVVDRSAFAPSVEVDPAAFDGEGQRPYNAAPDALLINFRSLVMSFTPQPEAGVARVSYAPPLAGVALPATVPLTAGDCGDWHGALRAELGDPAAIRFAGGLPAACGEKSWAVAYADPPGHTLRAIGGLWAEMGGGLRGRVREGAVPAGLQPAFALESRVMAEVVRDVNKFSNNVMAQHLLLTLGLARGGRGDFDTARAVVARWWRERVGGEPPVIDNGAGLSRNARISAADLARMLQVAWRSPVMPDLMASLPASGIDGTLRNRALASGGSAHLKTGSLRDVSAVAGYVDGPNGHRWVLVAIANDPNAGAARPAFNALADWATREAGR